VKTFNIIKVINYYLFLLFIYLLMLINVSAKELPSPVNEVSITTQKLLIEDWAVDLDAPWGVSFIAEGVALITEKKGNLLLVTPNSKRKVIGIPTVANKGQGGLLDVALDPNYSKNGWVYLSFSDADKNFPEKTMTKIVRGKLSYSSDAVVWKNEEVLFQAKPEDYMNTGFHFGSRISFDNNDHLYFGIGDRGVMDMSQSLNVPNGKIHRVKTDGTIPKNNPFNDGRSKYPSIYTYGNRNPQGIVVHPVSNIVWETEHGPKGGDELNVIKPGLNYGWPKVSYGINYDGSVLTEFVDLPDMEQPKSYWTPSIAVSSLEVYKGEMFSEWKDHLLVGALADQSARVIKVKNGSYISEEILIKDLGRVRDVTPGPDGAIYVLLPSKMIRISR
jgi:glucose/arabinose dehydrogenase